MDIAGRLVDIGRLVGGVVGGARMRPVGHVGVFVAGCRSGVK
jgi:hypothetical protein